MSTSRRTMNIADIKVGKRYRLDMGDIAGLAADITSNVGLLLQPIVVRRKGQQWWLVVGARRLAAAKLAGVKTIPVVAHDNMDDATALRAEFAENTQRKDFTLSEAVAIKRALEPLEREAAKQRMVDGGKRKGSGKLPTPAKGRAADKAAKATGMARRTLEKAEAIVDAAEAEPERFGKLLDAMDRTGRANGVYRRLRNIQQAEAIRAEPPPLPGNGPYRAGMIDIPWAYEPDDENAPERGVLPYATLSIEQACALNVGSIMHEDAILGMWVTNYILSRGDHATVLRAWGFEPKTVVTWPKDHVGRGHWALGETEHLVIAVRGKPIVTLAGHTTLLKGPFHLVRKGLHSTKPVEAYIYFESRVPAPRYADLFSRYQHNERWDCHGDQAPGTYDAQDDITPGAR